MENLDFEKVTNTKSTNLAIGICIPVERSENILGFCNVEKIKIDTDNNNNSCSRNNNNNNINDCIDDSSINWNDDSEGLQNNFTEMTSKGWVKKDFNLFILKDVTNNLSKEERTELISRRLEQCRKKEIKARQRWALLAKALFDPRKLFSQDFITTENSVRNFATFGLFKTENLKKVGGGHWLECSFKVLDKTYRVEIRGVEQNLTAKDLAGFNNTGNICIWPSEEVLAFLLLSNLGSLEGKKILELGGGMTCLAGLLLATYGRDCRVDLTDGNPVSVKNVQKIIEGNGLHENKVKSFQLNWVDHQKLSETYDLVLSSDCLFFDDSREDLTEAIWNSLNENGTAFVVAPKRGNTLNSFVSIAKRKGFLCSVHHYYNDIVWRKHLEFKASKAEYDENLHYPILVLLRKPDFKSLKVGQNTLL